MKNKWIMCGNDKCGKYYIKDKYGFNWANRFVYTYIHPKDTPGLPEEEVNEMCQKWRNRVTRKRWFICAGCKTTHYCSRRCQKLSWNRYGHRKNCKKLQKLIVNVSAYHG